MSLDVSLPGAFIAGLLSFASPCVLPLVPAYLGFLAGAGGPDATAARGRTVALALAFVLGFAAVFVLLGATASTLGQWLARHAEVFTMAAGALLVAFGLHMLGLVRIPWLYRQARFQVERRPVGPAGAFLVGLAFGFGWSPCVGPILAAILMVAGAQASLPRGMVLLAFYAAGIGVPFLLAAAFAGPFLKWAAAARQRLGLVEKASGALLVVTGAVFLSGLMPEVSQFLLDRIPGLGAIG